PGPDPLQRVAVHLAHSVPVVVPRPFPHRVVDRRVLSSRLGQLPVSAPLVGVHHRPGPGRRHHQPLQRRPERAPQDPQPELPRPPAIPPGDRRPVDGPGAVPLLLIATPSRWVVGVAVRDPFFPPHSGTSRRPRLRRPATASAPRRPPPLWRGPGPGA